MLLVAALAGFVYYTLWVIVTVRATHVRRRSASRAHQPTTLGPSRRAPTLSTPLLYLMCKPQPFVELGHTIHSYFPPREFAVAIPTVLLVLLVTIATTFIALVILNTRDPRHTHAVTERSDVKGKAHAA